MPCGCGAEPSSKDLGVQVSEVYDGVLIWSCRSCGELYPRFPPPGRLHDKALEIIQRWKENSGV